MQLSLLRCSGDNGAFGSFFMATDTTEHNKQMGHFDEHENLWLFGYGSLIYKVDFPVLDQRPARIRGWSRRFWQGSHDHRGTPEAPGRVVTLIEELDAVCMGMAYQITPEVFDHLDYREKNGYHRFVTELEFSDHDTAEGLVYIATPSNAAFLGDAPLTHIADQIRSAHGPSGSNQDYIRQLDSALEALGVVDEHIREIVELL